MENTEKHNPLGTEPVGKLMIRFAVPSIVAMLVGALYNIVDQLFIGQAVGLLGNSATNVAFPLTTSCIAISLLFGVGGASCFNLALGRGEKEKAPHFAANAITMLISGGILISAVTLIFLRPLMTFFGATDEIMPYALDYVSITACGFPFLVLTTGGGHIVRADGSPRITMICNITGAVVNTVLDALFVLRFGWGMKGAALATVIGQVISAIIILMYMFRFRTVKLTAKHFIPSFGCVSHIAGIGTASFFNQIAMMIVQIVLNNSLRKYGAGSVYGSEIPLAVAGIVMKVNQVIFSVVIGLAQGTQPIESFNYGAGDFRRVKSAYSTALITSLAISLSAFAAFQLIPRNILGLFGTNESELYFELGEKFFRIFLMFTVLNAIQPITSTFFTSIGKPIKGVFLSLTRQIIFFLPALLLLPHRFGLDGILYSGPIADIASAVTGVAMAIFEFRTMRKAE